MYAITVSPQHEVHRSLTLNILQGTPQGKIGRRRPLRYFREHFSNLAYSRLCTFRCHQSAICFAFPSLDAQKVQIQRNFYVLLLRLRLKRKAFSPRVRRETQIRFLLSFKSPFSRAYSFSSAFHNFLVILFLFNYFRRKTVKRVNEPSVDDNDDTIREEKKFLTHVITET